MANDVFAPPSDEDLIFSDPVKEAPAPSAPASPFAPASDEPLQMTPQGGMGVTRAFTSHANDMILALPDTVIDGAVYAMEKAGLIDPAEDRTDHRGLLGRLFNRGSYDEKQTILGFLDIGKGQRRTPEGVAEKIAAGAGTGTGAGLTFAAGAGALANSGAKAGSSIAGQTFNDVMQAYKSAPAGAAFGEVLTGATAGAGGELGGMAEKKAFGTESGIGTMLGGVAGGSPLAAMHGIASIPGVKTAGDIALGAASGIPGAGFLARKGAEFGGQAANAVLDKVIPSRAAKSFGKHVNREFATAYKDASDKGIVQRTDDIYRRFEEEGLEKPQFDAAQETLDPGLKVQREKMNKRALGPDARANQDLVNTNKDRIRGFLDQTVPHRDDDAPSMVIDVLKGKATKEIDEIDNEIEYLTRSAEVVNRRLPRQESITERGKQIRDAIEADKAAASQEMDQLAEELGINLKGPGRGFQGIKQEIRDQFFERNTVLQKRVPKIIREVAGMDESKLNFQEWKKFKDVINSELHQSVSMGASDATTQLTKFKKFWDDVGDRAFGEMGENWKTFKQAYEERYMPYEKGAAFRIGKQSLDSRASDVRYTTIDEQVADAFFKSAQDAKDFMDLTAEQPEARQAMRDIVLDKVRTYAEVGKNHPYAGGLDPNRVRQFMDKNRDTLSVLGLDKELDDYNKIMTQLVDRNAELTKRKELISKDTLNKVLLRTNRSNNPLEEGDVRAEDIIRKSIGDRVLMKGLVKRVSELDDPEVMNSFREAVAKELIGDKTLLENNPEQFRKNFEANKENLRMALGKEHTDNLELVLDAYQRATFGLGGIEGGGVATKSMMQKFKDFVGVSPESLESRIREARSGRVAPPYVALALANRFMTNKNRQLLDKMVERAMKDPAAARLLALPTDEAGVPAPAVERRLRAWMLETGFESTKEAAGVKQEEQFTPKSEPLPPAEEPAAPPAPSTPPASPSFVPQTFGAADQPPAPQQAPQQPGKTPYAALFPHDQTGIAIAGAQGYAEGGWVREGWRPSTNVEDRRMEPIPEWLEGKITYAQFPSNDYDYLSRWGAQTDPEQWKRIEDKVDAHISSMERGYPDAIYSEFGEEMWRRLNGRPLPSDPKPSYKHAGPIRQRWPNQDREEARENRRRKKEKKK